jgi:hypothetical protein
MKKILQSIFISTVLINSLQIYAGEFTGRVNVIAQDAATQASAAARRAAEAAQNAAGSVAQTAKDLAARVRAFSFKDSAPKMLQRAKGMSNEVWLKAKNGMGRVITKFAMEGDELLNIKKENLNKWQKNDLRGVNRTTPEGKQVVGLNAEYYNYSRQLLELQIEKGKLQRLKNAVTKYSRLKKIINEDGPGGIKDQMKNLNAQIEVVTAQKTMAERNYMEVLKPYRKLLPKK